MDTETTSLTNYASSRQKIENLLALKKITVKDIEDFTPLERDHLAETASQALSKLNGVDRDKFLDKIDEVMNPATKSNLWECNHVAISDAISRLMREYGAMPTKSAIALETGLSRQTINKHFKEYKTQPEFISQIEEFKFMAPKMLANVFKFAGDGDMRAARLYFEMVGALNKPQHPTPTGPTNYIQINNTILSQETLKQLTAEQLNQIEGIISGNGVKENKRARKMSGETIRI